MTLGVCFLAIGIFGVCYCVGPRMGKITSAVTGYISKASLCIYLIHMFILYEMGDLKLTVSTLPILCIISVPMVMAVCFAISIGIYFILSHIPIVKKWLV